LPRGSTPVDLGAFIDGSGFTFTVDAAGNVSVDRPAAANASGSSITFNTTSITIDAGQYTGRYFLSIFGTAVEYHGNQIAVLVNGLVYVIDNGTEIANSSLLFALDATGNVSTTAAAATGSGTTLSLHTVPVTIDPQMYTAVYFVSAFYPTPFTGPQTLNMLPGLTYTIDDGAEIGGSAFVFFVDAQGNVTTSSVSASSSGSTLTLANVVLHLDPTFTGTYSTTGYPNLQGSFDLVFIPELQVVVTTPIGSAVIVPDAQLAGTLAGVAVSARAPYTAAIQPPINRDGSSVFRANRGVVPVKFTLAANGVATCQLPAATISLLRTSGTSAGLVNQSDYIQPSDSGSNFRIDTTACQYVYNLGTSTLGAGQYVVQIGINNAVVGSGTFGLK
jgi:hypothetical protein